jgi:hypothetical protein
MQNQVLGQDAAPTASYLLPTLGAELTTFTFHSPYLSEAEKLRANHHIHECEDAQRLTHWLHTVRTELARRNIAAQTKRALAHRPLPYPYTRRQLQLLRRAAKSTGSTLALHHVVDHPAPARDRRAAAQFQPLHTLTYTQLLRH